FLGNINGALLVACRKKIQPQPHYTQTTHVQSRPYMCSRDSTSNFNTIHTPPSTTSIICGSLSCATRNSQQHTQRLITLFAADQYSAQYRQEKPLLAPPVAVPPNSAHHPYSQCHLLYSRRGDAHHPPHPPR
ncbi:unnamed protein product, partial [Heterosigma akashiwo]